MFPKISIIIPCYNHGRYIHEAIQSVEYCDEKNLYELIILNDGSSDKYTIEVLQTLTEKGYHVINQNNQGLGAARNNAIKAAKGEYILPLDSDNKIRPEYIRESIRILDNHPEIAMVYGDASYFGEKQGVRKVGEFNLQKIMLENYIDACSVYRKSVWESLGGYDEKMPVMGYEDWDFWLNMSFNKYEFFYIPKVLYDYRVSTNSMIHSIHSNEEVILGNYLQEKYKRFLNRNYIGEVLIKAGKNNKKLAFKFFISLYFPGFLDFLVKKNVIKSKEIF